MQVSYGYMFMGCAFFLATELIEGVRPDPALRDAAAHALAVKVWAVLAVGGFSSWRFQWRARARAGTRPAASPPSGTQAPHFSCVLPAFCQ